MEVLFVTSSPPTTNAPCYHIIFRDVFWQSCMSQKPIRFMLFKYIIIQMQETVNLALSNLYHTALKMQPHNLLIFAIQPKQWGSCFLWGTSTAKFPDKATEAHLLWLNESYIDLTVLNKILLFKVRRYTITLSFFKSCVLI